MKNVTLIILISVFLGNNWLVAQQTVGLFLNTEDSYNGYTLFAPIPNKTTYLIDNCGEKVHSWVSLYRPGLSVYLLENGDLLRTGNTLNDTFTSGGSGGIIEIIDWNGNVIWNYTISTYSECQHHDVEYLPNGNILAIVWDLKTNAEALQAGRVIAGNDLWSEKIIEIQPDYVNGGGNIVWEWKAWDHLVQDNDSTKNNYGDVSTSPGLIDINFYSGNPINKDWLHINAVDYNENLDQIVLSNHNFSEIWIIDHSTTTLEAAGHTGGNSNKGGDLLYRWGNPQTYKQGTNADQKLFKQHDSHWINDSLIDGGMIMIFNNQAGGQINYSTVDIIDPPVDANGNYPWVGSAYSPGGFHWTYKAATPTDFYAQNVSGAQRLPDSNTLVCEGSKGRFFEVDYFGNIVWEYVNPVKISGPVSQGAPAVQNSVFRCARFNYDYPALAGKPLVPQGYIESGSTFSCILYTNIDENNIDNDISIFPNPSSGLVNIQFDNRPDRVEVRVLNTTGQSVFKSNYRSNENIQVNLQDLNSGIYFVKITADNRTFSGKLIVK